MTNQSLPIVEAIRNEANRVISTLRCKTPISSTTAETALESLKIVADKTVPDSPIRNALQIRLACIRGKLPVQSIQLIK